MPASRITYPLKVIGDLHTAAMDNELKAVANNHADLLDTLAARLAVLEGGTPAPAPESVTITAVTPS